MRASVLSRPSIGPSRPFRGGGLSRGGALRAYRASSLPCHRRRRGVELRQDPICEIQRPIAGDDVVQPAETLVAKVNEHVAGERIVFDRIGWIPVTTGDQAARPTLRHGRQEPCTSQAENRDIRFDNGRAFDTDRGWRLGMVSMTPSRAGNKSSRAIGAGDNASSSESAMFVLPAARNVTGQNWWDCWPCAPAPRWPIAPA
jgi:hypothetical protein